MGFTSSEKDKFTLILLIPTVSISRVLLSSLIATPKSEIIGTAKQSSLSDDVLSRKPRRYKKRKFLTI